MKTIDNYVEKAHQDSIPLIDVRPKEMYKEGHIPGAINIPFDQVDQADIKPGSYLYCVTGVHAHMAAEALAQKGILTTDIGGITNYTGPIVK